MNMNRIYTLLIGLLLSLAGFSQPTITEVHAPQYMPADGVKTPYACRLTINGLNPGATYRYFNRFTYDIWDFSNGEGIYTLVSSTGTFSRVVSPSLSTAGRYGEFTTNAAGSYTGWFIAEAEAFSPTFLQGSIVYVRLILNNGAGGTLEEHILTAENAPITMLGTDPSAPSLGTGIRSTPAAAGVGKNFVMLYDNTAGTGRPIAGTFIESDGITTGTVNGYADFYVNAVDNTPKAWGSFIPNELPGGIQKIVQYNLTDGAEAGSRQAASGTWAKEGGGRVSTINPSGGTTDVIVLNGNIVTLGSPAKFNQTITFATMAAKQYGGADFDPGATSSAALAITYTSSNPAVATIVSDMVHIVGAGTAVITARQAGDEDFNAATDITQTLTVNKAPLTIKVNDQTKVQGDPFPTWTATYTGFVNGDDPADLSPAVQFQTTALVNSPAGTYPITASGAGSLNYTITYQPGTLTVTSNKQPQTITFGAIAPVVYGAADLAPGATINSGLTPQYRSSNPAVATIVGNLVHITGAGSTVITAAHPGDANWEPAADVTQTLVVNKKSLTISADNKTKLQGHVNPVLTITYAGFVYAQNNSALTTQPVINTSATTSSPVGDYAITVTGATSANYAITQVNAILTVQPLPSQNITFSNLAAKKYGDAPFPAGATASSGLPVSYSSSNPQVATVTGGEVHIHGVGTASIVASQPGDASNAPAPDVTRTLVVSKVVLTLRADDKTKLEGENNPALTVTYSGFVNNENESILTVVPVVSTNASSSSLIGTYPINITGAAAANYTLLTIPGRLTVLPAQGANQSTVAAFCSSPGQLQVNIFTDTAQKGVIQLFDPSGNRLLNAPVTISKGANSFRYPIGNTAAGVYYVRVIAKEFTRKEKVRIR